MGNDRLRAAMRRTGITGDVLAERAEVDPETVQQWLRGRVPHPAHRWAVSQELGEDEEYLWPDARRRSVAGNGSTSELLATYAHRADVDQGRWRDLIDRATSQIDLLGYTLYFLPQLLPDLVETLLAKADTGCRLRLVVADPACEQVRLRDVEEQEPITIVARIRSSLRAFRPLTECKNKEIRLQAAPLYNSVYRFDDEMLVTPHLYATPGHAAPLLHLRRLGPGGLFSKFASHFEGLWSDSAPMGQDRKEERASTPT